ncbi:MAG: serine/threonine protein kinase, partial [Myxococcales bacterium]|nr:serine/threonine protein kinase [Myxococcales bacterium]
MDDRYDEKEPIGTGGMSTVLRVFDRVLLRETAQKLMDPRFSGSRRHVERFMTEARVTGQLEHPNIVPVHDYGTTPDGVPFINMKLVEGDTLEDLVAEAGDGRLDPDCLAGFIRILLKICDALAFAHSKGVIHRDLNPANIMVGPFGEVYLMDWGVSTRTDGSSIRLDGGPDGQNTDISGTPAYMAPEQIRGLPLDSRTDVFALGATLYHVVTGHPPFPGPSAIQALNQALECDWTPLDRLLGERSPA